MKAFVVMLFAVQAFGSFAFVFWSPTPSPAAVLEFANDDITIESPLCGKSAAVTAVIKNRGVTIGKLLDVQKSCGCLDVGLKCPLDDQPGESVNVPVEVRVPASDGKRQSFGIIFVFDAGSGRAYSLPLRIEVIGRDCPSIAEAQDEIRPTPDPRF